VKVVPGGLDTLFKYHAVSPLVQKPLPVVITMVPSGMVLKRLRWMPEVPGQVYGPPAVNAVHVTPWSSDLQTMASVIIH